MGRESLEGGRARRGVLRYTLGGRGPARHLRLVHPRQPLRLCAAVRAGRGAPGGGRTRRSTPIRILWIVLAMVTARSAAMAFNRIVDARWDALNPRTANREIPTGKLSCRRPGPFSSQRRRRSSRRPGRSAGSASRCRRWRSRSCSGTRSPSASPATRSCSSAWRWRLRPSVAGWRRAAELDWRAVLAGPRHRHLGRRLRRALRLPGVTFDRAHGLQSIPVRFGVAASL